MPHPKHILVIRFSAMGDVAMTVPVLRALTDQHPNIKVTVVTRAFFKPFFSGIKNVEVYEADLHGKHKGVLGLYKLSKALKALDFDVVADLHNVLRSHILKCFFFGKKVVQIDKGRAEKKALVAGTLFQQLKTTHQRYADVFKKLGFTIDLLKPSFPKKAKLNVALSRYISNPENKTIGIAPFAAHKSKMYPLEQMEAVIAELSKQYNVILFGGGMTEIEILNTLESKYNNTQSVAGKLNLEDELALISNLDVMLSMDSGNGHLAAIFGVHVVTIWSVTHPYAGFVPFNQPKTNQLLPDRNQYPNLPTSVYGNTYPEGYEKAAGSITSESVILKIKTIVSA